MQSRITLKNDPIIINEPSNICLLSCCQPVQFQWALTDGGSTHAWERADDKQMTESECE